MKKIQLKELDLHDKVIEQLLKPDWLGYLGFAPYELTNNSAEIRRLKKRIEDLTKRSTLDDIETDYTHFIFKRDIEDNRYCFIFDGKPSVEVRKILGDHSFLWSSQRIAWVRKITSNARYASDQVIKLLLAYFNKA